MKKSPFKFLNAYEQEDREFFFGREKETEDLYELTYDTRLLLIVGASGTGKTSIIQCGLANRFSSSRWYDIFIRRDQNMISSIDYQFNRECESLGLVDYENFSIQEKLRSIYSNSYKPIYLIFDQFEELFLINENPTEQNEFFLFLKETLELTIPCKVIIVIREEFISYLWKFEEIIPTFFDHRYRIDRLRSNQIQNIVGSLLSKLQESQLISLDDSEDISSIIVDKLSQSKGGSELSYLQVYLDKLYQQANQSNGRETPRFDHHLINQVGSFDDILGEFLEDQISLLETELGTQKREIPIKILSKLITDERTKRIISDEELNQLHIELGIDKKDLDYCIQRYEAIRIIKMGN